MASGLSRGEGGWVLLETAGSERNNPLSALALNSGRRWAGAAVPRAGARRTEERTDRG